MEQLLLFYQKQFSLLIKQVLAATMFFFFSLCECGALKFPHYTVGFGNGSVFVLGFFPVVVFVWGVGLFHTGMLDSMLRSVSVGVEAC